MAGLFGIKNMPSSLKFHCGKLDSGAFNASLLAVNGVAGAVDVSTNAEPVSFRVGRFQLIAGGQVSYSLGNRGLDGQVVTQTGAGIALRIHPKN